MDIDKRIKNSYMKIVFCFIAVMLGLTMSSCKHQGEEPKDTMRQEAVETVDNGVSLEVMSTSDEDVDKAMQEAMDKAKSTPVNAPTPHRAVKNVVATTPAVKTSNKTETLYVETDDARGRVWGHVTMKGDRGTGTVHDEGENTWTVTVTRHGNELYAVDQNSRQYVFKLKK